METDKIYAALSEIMGDLVDQPGLALTPESSASDVSGWDSFTNITFIVEVERRFGLKFNTGEVEEFRNVGDLVAMIKAKTQ